MNSSGSAIAENEKWLDSIEGKTYQFTNALQTMWSNMISSEAIKGFLDFGTGAVQLLDTTTGKIIALVSALQLVAKFKGFSIKGIAKGLGDTIKQITTAQQTLTALGKTTKIGKGFDFTNINVYAQAVSNLTAQQQANLLAAQDLNREQIQHALTLNQVGEAATREAMAHVHAASAKEQEAAAGANLFRQKTLEVAASLRTRAATEDETRAKELNIVADILENSTSKEAVANNLQEAVSSKTVSASLAAETAATVGLTAAKQGLAATMKALMIANPVGFWMTIATTVLSLIPVITSFAGKFIKTAEEIKEEANEIVQTYTDAAQEIDSNLKTLTTSSDSNLYATLSDEFAVLAQGVDKYGNNISLTSDQYERYKQICEQIVGIQPSIASGYDSATHAIGDNISVLNDLIELQKESARYNAEQRIGDDNLNTLRKDAFNDYNSAKQDKGSSVQQETVDVWKIFSEMYAGKEKLVDNGAYSYYEAYDTIDIMEDILKKMNPEYNEKQISDLASKYQSGSHIRVNEFVSDYYEQMIDNVSKFGVEYSDALNESLTEVEKAIVQGDKKISKANDALVDDFLVVPQGQDAGEYYDTLNQSSKKFVTDWIKSGSQFKVDHIGESKELAKQSRENIISFVEDLASGSLDFELDGQQITGQDFLDKIYNFDTTGINWGDYKSQMQSLMETFWQQIGAEQNAYGMTQNDLFVAFGLEFITKEGEDGGAQEQTRNQVGKMIGKSAEEMQDWLNSLPPEKVNAFYKIEWNNVDNSGIKSFDDVEAELEKQAMHFNAPSPKTYSVLANSASAFNDIQTQTAEILHNGTQVTQEYKDALLELGVSSADLNACFDENNQYLVSNAAGLKYLVKQAKDNAAANVKLARSHARLKYSRLVNELNELLSSNKALDSSTMQVADAIMSQMDAIDQAIYKYQLLEDQLLGTQNAFTSFAQAKDIDSLNTYGDSYVEMVQTIYDAYAKTGEVGSEAVSIAVDYLIPKDKLAGLERHSDEWNEAVNEYLNKNLVPTLTLDDGNLSLDIDSIARFVENGLGKIFDGSSAEDFNLKDTILLNGEEVEMNLKNAAAAMEMTETQAYSFLAALKQFTGVDFLSMLDGSTEGKMSNLNEKLAELNRQKLELLQSGGYEANKAAIDDINAKIEEVSASLVELREQGKKELVEYEVTSGLIDELSKIATASQNAGEKLADMTGEDLMKKNIGFTSEIEDAFNQDMTELGVELTFNAANGEEIFAWLIKRKEELEEPTVLTVGAVIDDNVSRIETLKQGLAELDDLNLDSKTAEITIEGKLMNRGQIEDEIAALESRNAELKVKFGIEDAGTVQAEMEVINNYKIYGKSFSVSFSNYYSLLNQLDNIIYKIQQINNGSFNGNANVNGDVHNRPNGEVWTPTADGTAHAFGTAYKSGSWGAPKTTPSLVGELGPELLVRGNKWHVIGEHGAEFTQVKKGDIIFNHKQTESLFENGYVTGRGRMVGSAHASGTANLSGNAYASLWNPTTKPNTGSSTSGSSSGGGDTEDFEETFDWFEVLLEEINEQLDLMNAKLENAVGISAKGSLIDELLSGNKYKITELTEGIKLYTDYAAKLLQKVPAAYREMAKDGAVHITDFLGEANEETVEAINNYREWAQKVADLNQQLEETKTEISDLAKQKFDVVADEYDNILSILQAQNDQFDAQISLMEDRGYVASATYYESMIQNIRAQSAELEKEKAALKDVMDEQVALGNIQVGSEQWYEMVEALYDVDASIKDCVSDLESYQNAINDIHWDNFENLTNRIDYLKNETQSLIDLMDSEDMVITPKTEDGWSADAVEWSKEGMASLGLYAQQMEIAEYTARQYAEAIDDLNKDFKAGKYSESEYQEKLEDLTSAQYDSIEAYYDAQDAIKDLHKARVDAIKEGIEKEISAYEKLIQKKKEELDADKNLYDFEKSIAEQQKNISDIERKIAALSVDTTMSGVAKRKELETELAKAKYDLEQSYHDRSVANQQEALDKELENYKEEKDKEVEALEEYLEDVKTVVADSLVIIQENASGIYNTLKDKAEEYNLTLSDSIVSPWQDGALAISDFQSVFDTAISSTTDKLEEMKNKWQEVIDKMAAASNVEINSQAQQNDGYVTSTPVPTVPTKETSSNKKITVGGKINAGSSTIYSDYNGDGAGKQYYASDPIYTVLQEKNGYVLVRHHSLPSGYSGWFKKSDVKAYAKGTTGTKSNELAWIDELGEELIMHADGSGRLSFLSKGTAVIPHDISENLMKLGQLDPSEVLNRNKPSISVSPSVVTNNMEINMEIAEIVHVDAVTNETIPDLTKAIEKQMDKYMKNINNNIRKYTR